MEAGGDFVDNEDEKNLHLKAKKSSDGIDEGMDVVDVPEVRDNSPFDEVQPETVVSNSSEESCDSSKSEVGTGGTNKNLHSEENAENSEPNKVINTIQIDAIMASAPSLSRDEAIDADMETIATDMETISIDTEMSVDGTAPIADSQLNETNFKISLVKTADLKNQKDKEIECMEVDESVYNQSMQETAETDPIASAFAEDSANKEYNTSSLPSTSTKENRAIDSVVVPENINAIADKIETSDISAHDSIDLTADPSQENNMEDPIGSVAKENVDDSIVSDAIISESAIGDFDESILPDTGKVTEESKETENEEYIVTNSAEKSSYECMQCNKTEVPKYACSFNDKIMYICHEDCLKDLKEKKPGKVVVRDLRVKVFATEDLTRNLPLQQTIEASSAFDQFTCKVCSKSFKGEDHFSWNTVSFCSDLCLNTFQKMRGTKCVECKTDVPENLMGKYSVRFGTEMKQFCKNSCLLDHKKGQRFCSLCQGQLMRSSTMRYCSKICSEMHTNVVPEKGTGLCGVCMKDKTLEIEYVDSNKKKTFFCGDPCFVAYKFVNNVNPVQCEFCKKYADDQSQIFSFTFEGIEHLLCSKECQKLLIITTRKIVHCMWCNVKKYNFDMVQIAKGGSLVVMCSLNCYNLHVTQMQDKLCHLCRKEVEPLYHLRMVDGAVHNFCSPLCLNSFKDNLPGGSTGELQIQSTESQGTDTNEELGDAPTIHKAQVKKYVVMKPRPIPKQRNVSTMCKPYQVTKAISCKPKEMQRGCQTDAFSNKLVVPIPVPIYVPMPVHMFNIPVPVPFPFPVPIPVPIFIPTCRKSISGIQKEISKIKNKVPADPLEAELLMMAEMVAEDKKPETDSESEVEPDIPETLPKEESFEPEPEQLDANNSFGEDVLQMALKMASDFEEPVDLEGAVAATTIAVQSGGDDSSQRIGNIMDSKRRSIRQARQGKKKQQVYSTTPPQQALELEKPDANMCLKYTFGVNAWKQWVSTKNNELQKSAKKGKLFKTEILQLTADELNFSLCLFVKEVRKPNGAEYAPDTIYYLCLGIQQFLYENGRIDNIFCDTFYDKFTDCLNEVCRKFSVLYNESQYIVTRVEEEHLWESKQLGAHSPLVLLNTLMFFNTKHFSLITVDDHLQLSFSHIMKHWKRNPNQPGARNVLLRFYPPQSPEGTRKKKVYEQQENEDNPLRCPVKLYEFYLSKCPESVKTRNDVFYLQPERSCVPDSPVWYSTMALNKEPLEKMLNRIKMVKEINVALLTT